MSLNNVDKIANAILYEGYILYPYRRSSVKNRHRWNFGVLYPPAYVAAQKSADNWSFQTECLATTSAGTELIVRVRFLQMVMRQIAIPRGDGERNFEPVDSLVVNGQMFQSWQEALEREVTVRCELSATATGVSHDFMFSESQSIKELRELEAIRGLIIRSTETIQGNVTVSVEPGADSLFKIRVIAGNRIELDRKSVMDRDRALMKSMLSAHATLSLGRGDFISSLDPPERFRAASADCRNAGCWPVLVGEEGERDTMLASPIILYDYPRVADQSAGDLFDGTEIDEILSLRILTLTEEEKIEMAAADAFARRMLERTEALNADEFMKMHGVMKPANL